MTLLLNNFRRHISEGPTNRVSKLIFFDPSGPSKVAYFRVEFFIKNNVFWFYISVNKLEIMHVFHSRSYLEKNSDGQIFRQSILRVYVKIKTSIYCVFQNHIDEFFDLEGINKFHDVKVIEFFVDFDFLLQILLILTSDSRYVDFFQCVYFLIENILNAKHMRKPSFPNNSIIVEENEVIQIRKHYNAIILNT